MDILMAKVEEPTALVNPPEGVMDRIHFVINNVTTSNLSSKVCLYFEVWLYACKLCMFRRRCKCYACRDIHPSAVFS